MLCVYTTDDTVVSTVDHMCSRLLQFMLYACATSVQFMFLCMYWCALPTLSSALWITCAVVTSYQSMQR